MRLDRRSLFPEANFQNRLPFSIGIEIPVTERDQQRLLAAIRGSKMMFKNVAPPAWFFGEVFVCSRTEPPLEFSQL
jgi:hypothetical protein